VSLDPIPHLTWPLQVVNGSFRSHEQDTVDELVTNVAVIISFPLGFRDESPEFGIADPTFEQMPLDVNDVLEAVETYEPRAEVQITQRPYDPRDPHAAKVGIRVTMPDADDDAALLED
jgi:hypothetical protein